MFHLVERVGVINHLNLPGLLPSLGDGFFHSHLGRDFDVAGVHESCGFVLGIRRRGHTLSAPFGHHRNFHLTGGLQNLVGEIQAGKPSPRRCQVAVQEDLSDAVLSCVINQSLRAVFPVNHLGRNVQVLGKAQVAINRRAVLRMHGRRLLFGVNIHCNADGLQMVGHAPRPAQQHGGRGISCDIDQDFFRRFRLCRLPGLAGVQRLRRLPDRQLAQGNQNRFLEQQRRIALQLVGRKDGAPFQAMQERTGSDIDNYNFIGLLEQPIGNGFANS